MNKILDKMTLEHNSNNRRIKDDLRSVLTDNRVCAEVKADEISKYLFECLLFYMGKHKDV